MNEKSVLDILYSIYEQLNFDAQKKIIGEVSEIFVDTLTGYESSSGSHPQNLRGSHFGFRIQKKTKYVFWKKIKNFFWMLCAYKFIQINDKTLFCLFGVEFEWISKNVV